MSRIEDTAKPTLIPLLRGEPTLLEPLHQWLLASFLCLVTQRLELSNREAKAIPEKDRKHLMNTLQPSDHWSIWIAHYIGEEANEHNFMHCAMQFASPQETVTGPEHCNTQVTTLVAGQFCAHVLSSTNWPSYLVYDPPIRRIWPPGQLTIDTGFLPALDQSGTIALHEAIPALGGNSPKG